MILKFISVLVLFVSLMFTDLVQAAGIRSFENLIIVIEGKVRKGDFKRFVRLVKEGQGRATGVWLFYPGGDFSESIKIGRALRELELSSQVPSVV